MKKLCILKVPEERSRIRSWIRDILVRIQIPGSVPLSNGSGSNTGVHLGGVEGDSQGGGCPLCVSPRAAPDGLHSETLRRISKK